MLLWELQLELSSTSLLVGPPQNPGKQVYRICPPTPLQVGDELTMPFCNCAPQEHVYGFNHMISTLQSIPCFHFSGEALPRSPTTSENQQVTIEKNEESIAPTQITPTRHSAYNQAYIATSRDEFQAPSC